MSFAADVREKLLLWCDRRCCLCRRTCDLFMEVHHIVPQSRGGGDDEDNAIPLCFDCHAKVGHYDDSQPRGSKFKPEELKKRRDQVYEECTRHLVPSLDYAVRQGGRRLPDVGFTIAHRGDGPQVKVVVKLDVYVDGQRKNRDKVDPLYRGGMPWNLNPKQGVNGHFPVVDDACRDGVDLRTGVDILVVDIYGKPHNLLPVTYVYERGANEWWLDPVEVTDSLALHKARSNQLALAADELAPAAEAQDRYAGDSPSRGQR